MRVIGDRGGLSLLPFVGPAPREGGRVARYDESVGYGFLVGEDHRAYFLHRTAIVGPPLRVGDVVDFVPDQGTRWPRARTVRRVSMTVTKDAAH